LHPQRYWRQHALAPTEAEARELPHPCHLKHVVCLLAVTVDIDRESNIIGAGIPGGKAEGHPGSLVGGEAQAAGVDPAKEGNDTAISNAAAAAGVT
jgi:hypothetical protein